MGRAINEARAYSRVLNETFNQGTVGRLTGAMRNAGDAVAPAAALGVSVGRSGAAGAVSVDDIRRAAPTADAGIEDFLKGRFTDRAAPRGQFSPNRADDFMRVNREVMDRHPRLADEFTQATGAARRAEGTENRIIDVLRGVNNPRKSVGAAFTGANRGSEIATSVFKAQNPTAAMQELRRQAAKDPTGQAMAGLKDGFVDYVMDAASKGLDAQGIQNVVGDRLSGNLTRDAGIFEQIFSPDEMKRLRRIADEFKAINFSESGRSADALISDVPSSVLDFVGRTLAARQGAKLGGGISGASLVTANAATRKMRVFMENLTANKANLLLQKAIKDPDVMADLLLKITPQNADRIERRLVEWLAGVTAVEMSNQNEEGQRGRLSDNLSGGFIPTGSGPLSQQLQGAR